MLEVTVFGTRTYDFKDKSTGVQKKGITAHYYCDSISTSVRGMEYGKFSVGVDSPMYGTVVNLKLPAELSLIFNQFGNVQDFEVLG